MASVATVNHRLARNPWPNMEVVDVTFAASADYYVTKFANITEAVFTLKSCSGTAADMKLDYLTTPGTVIFTSGGTANRGTLIVFGH
jgi:hypothetical protein